MDKLITTSLGGFPFVLDDIRQFLGRLTSPANHGIYQAFNNLLRGYGENFIIQGVTVSGSTGAFSITEGWVLLDGELIKVDAQGPFDEVNDNKFVKVTTNDPRGNKSFLNGSIADTYEKNRAVVQGTSGNLDFDGSTFVQLASGAETLPDTGRVEIKKKVIEIGDWDMDTDELVNVSHGLSDILKIRSMEAVIISDLGNSVQKLDFFSDFFGGTSQGSVGTAIGANISLTRKTGGLFDSTSFDSTSFNRGFLTIEFEA